MGEAYLGEIRLVGFNFTIQGWKPCDGRLLQIAEYDALYILLGTIYGGDGVATFALPDLRSRIPIHMGQGAGLSLYTIGQQGGTESVTLTQNNLPHHSHRLLASTEPALSNTPVGSGYPAATEGTLLYSNTAASPTQLSTSTITPSGNSQPIDNMMPFLTINYQICVEGIFPPRN